jgi:hypothetical protein
VARARVASAERRKQVNKLLRTMAATGQSRELDLFRRVQALSDAEHAANLEFQEAQARIEAEMAGVLKPLPDVSPKLSTAGRAVSLMAEDRSAKEQFEELQAAWKAVAEATRDNREKLKKATAATPWQPTAGGIHATSRGEP